MLRTLLIRLSLRMLTRVITTLLPTVLTRPLLTVLPTEKTCFYGGVTGLSGRRPNLCGCVLAGGRRWACLLGALAAAPGSVAMLAHRLIAFRAASARGRFRFQAVIEFFGFLWTH
jgi:hypothetical protein